MVVRSLALVVLGQCVDVVISVFQMWVLTYLTVCPTNTQHATSDTSHKSKTFSKTPYLHLKLRRLENFPCTPINIFACYFRDLQLWWSSVQWCRYPRGLYDGCCGCRALQVHPVNTYNSQSVTLCFNIPHSNNGVALNSTFWLICCIVVFVLLLEYRKITLLFIKIEPVFFKKKLFFII